MLQIENAEVFGWLAAIRGMRNPMNSWDKSDSHECLCRIIDHDCEMEEYDHEPAKECNNGKFDFCLGKNDFSLMQKLTRSGPDHGKFLRMVNVTLDIIAPLYWWKEFDTYKVGTVANSCSTMHKIAAKEFSLDDFSHEHLFPWNIAVLEAIIDRLNKERLAYLEGITADKAGEIFITPAKSKDVWWQMIQLLPSSYNQRRTIQLNYEVLRRIYHARKNHKLDEWRTFCAWAEGLPYFREICIGEDENNAAD